MNLILQATFLIITNTHMCRELENTHFPSGIAVKLSAKENPFNPCVLARCNVNIINSCLESAVIIVSKWGGCLVSRDYLKRNVSWRPGWG